MWEALAAETGQQIRSPPKRTVIVQQISSPIFLFTSKVSCIATFLQKLALLMKQGKAKRMRKSPANITTVEIPCDSFAVDCPLKNQ
jgi:hypothetical protein